MSVQECQTRTADFASESGVVSESGVTPSQIGNHTTCGLAPALHAGGLRVAWGRNEAPGTALNHVRRSELARGDQACGMMARIRAGFSQKLRWSLSAGRCAVAGPCQLQRIRRHPRAKWRPEHPAPPSRSDILSAGQHLCGGVCLNSARAIAQSTGPSCCASTCLSCERSCLPFVESGAHSSSPQRSHLCR